MIGTLSKIASIREPSVHEGFPSVLCSGIISCAQHPKLPIFVECIIESMTQTSGLCRAHSSSFTVRPRVEQGTSWASDIDGKGHCRGRSGSTDFVPGRN